ncbi:oligosaccharide flippase family protein [Neobacillus niacini]|uniref:oligosaccharide flippase family protein n=1 Tax=Neobacillus niacini TaxID=86668 RepID=UPI0007ABE62A|nr:oligosaccharide flippase family protein [Neobacillus niacini]MEC1525878.1 oligosaccharide flippase family protein [Neobacillus niacini]
MGLTKKLLNKNLLLKNISWTFFGNIIYSACQWAILSIIAKVGSSLILGEFNLAFAITTPIFLFSSLQLRSVVATDHKNEYSFQEYFQLRFLLSILSLVAIIILAMFLNYDLVFSLVLIGIALIKFFESISDIFYGKFQQEERFDDISKSLIIRGILYIVLYFIGVFFLNSLLIGVILVNVSFIFLLYYDFKKLNERIHFKLDRKKLVMLTKKSIPLGLVVLIISLIDNVPKYFIEYNIGTSELGYYTSIVYVTIIGSTIVNAFGQASMTRLSLYFQQKKLAQFIKLQIQLIIFTIILGLSLVAFVYLVGDKLLVLLYNSDFANYYDEFKLIMIGAVFLFISSIFGYGITAARYFKVQPFILSIVLLSNAIFSFILIKDGIYGISIAYLLTSIINFLCHLCVFIYILRTSKKGEANDQSAPSY